MTLVLHGYWRSTASYRVRIALNLKGLTYRQVTHDLRQGAQTLPSYRALQPQGLVPALEADGAVLIQSPAILEWLEERFPAPPLLPAGLTDRATVRAMAALICSDIHPLNNLRVLTALRRDFAATEPQVSAWIARWIDNGFAALEPLVKRHGAGYAFGSTPTLADCCLVPQVYAAQRFGVSLAAFPAIAASAAHCLKRNAFLQAAPDQQPDAD